jgi:hypothetical protein
VKTGFEFTKADTIGTAVMRAGVDVTVKIGVDAETGMIDAIESGAVIMKKRDFESAATI